MEPQTNYRILGFTFIMLGIGLTASLGIALGPAFIGIGLPFVVLGVVFLAKDNETDGEEG